MVKFTVEVKCDNLPWCKETIMLESNKSISISKLVEYLRSLEWSCSQFGKDWVFKCCRCRWLSSDESRRTKDYSVEKVKKYFHQVDSQDLRNK